MSHMGYSILCTAWLIVAMQVSDAIDVPNEEALRECGNLHQLDFRSLPNASASFHNQNCALRCDVGPVTLANHSLNEGYPCPLDTLGICHQGQCIGSQADAVRECSNLHGQDFRKVHSAGTAFINEQCSLRCMIATDIVSSNPVNEGFPCPTKTDSICEHGQCVVRSVTTQSVTPTKMPATVSTKPNPVTVVPNGHLSAMHIDHIHLRVIGAELNQSHTNLSTLVCVQNGGYHAIQPWQCVQPCHTNTIATNTSSAQWNHECHFEKPDLQTRYFLTVGLFDKYGDNDDSLGTWVRTVLDFLNAMQQTKVGTFLPSSDHSRNRIHFVFEGRDYPIKLRGMGAPIGHYHLWFNFTLSNRHF